MDTHGMDSDNEMDHDSQGGSDYNDDESNFAEEENQSDSDLELEEICPLQDDSKVNYQGHTSGILCLDLDEKNNVVYTGGLDDKVMIWQLNSGRLIATLSGHNDSVTHLCVNNSGSFLASADMNGVVILWRRIGAQERWEKFYEIEAATIVGLKWSYGQGRELLLMCDVVGTVQSWSMDRLDQGPVQYKYGQGCSCNKYCVLLNDAWSAVLYGDTCGEHEDCGNTSSLYLTHNNTDKSVKVDLRTPNVAEHEGQDDEGLGAGWAHKSVNNQAHLIVIGDWAQMIVVSVNVAAGNTALCKLTKVPVLDGGLVDNISMSPVLPYVAYSTKLGLIGIYDLTKQSIRYQWNYANTMPVELRSEDDNEPTSVSQLRWSPNKPLFYTTGIDGRICQWDGRAEPTNQVPTMWGYSGIVWDMSVTRDGSTLVIVSEDKIGRLFAL